MTDQDTRGGLLLWIQSQPKPIRTIIFIAFVTLVTGAMFGATAFLYWLNLSNYPRIQPVAFADSGIIVKEFVRLDDADAYPAAVAARAGAIYTGSYASGTVWKLAENGTAQEIPQTRERIGSVIGLDISDDGRLFVLDHHDPLRVSGATIWVIDGDDLTEYATIQTEILAAPNDLVVDGAGNVYIADLGWQRVLKIASGSTDATIWWQSDDPAVAPAGLAYDASNERMLISDGSLNVIYAVSLSVDDPASATTILYRDATTQNTPGFNGITVGQDGTIYIAALSLNQVGQIDADGNQLTYLAGAFRGSSDVAYDETSNRLIVNNWDQRWLLPIEFLFLKYDIEPRLPFSIEAVELGG